MHPEFSLPDREAPHPFRARTLGVRIEPEDGGGVIHRGDQVCRFDARASGVIRWICARQSFSSGELSRAFELTPPRAAELLELLGAAGLVEEL